MRWGQRQLSANPATCRSRGRPRRRGSEEADFSRRVLLGPDVGTLRMGCLRRYLEAGGLLHSPHPGVRFSSCGWRRLQMGPSAPVRRFSSKTKTPMSFDSTKLAAAIYRGVRVSGMYLAVWVFVQLTDAKLTGVFPPVRPGRHFLPPTRPSPAVKPDIPSRSPL